MSLETLGWQDFYATQSFEEEGEPARVIIQERDRYVVATANREWRAEVSGRYRSRCSGAEDFPVVGDWVWIRTNDDIHATIHHRYERKSSLSRKTAGDRIAAQMLAANVESLFVVCAADGDWNLRRIERTLSGLWDSGATPLVVINKVDLCADVDALLQSLEPVALSVKVLTVSAVSGDGMDRLREHIPPGKTAVFLGSSGVGKSTLTNLLLGAELQATQEIRADDDKGRHTTTKRQLFQLPDAGCVIDTPGIREFQLWDSSESAFSDIEELAHGCRYRDCRHESEPGCAVREAVDSGALSDSRLESFHKLRRESQWIAAKQDALLRQTEKQKLKSMMKSYKKHFKGKNSKRT